MSITDSHHTDNQFALLFQSFSPSLSLALFSVQVPQLWNRVDPTQSEVWAPAPSHRVCTNMHGAHFHRCHQRTSIWITRQPAIFEFRQNGINTRWRAQTTTAQQHESPKQLGPGKGFIILYINVLINKDSKLNSLSHTHTHSCSCSPFPPKVVTPLKLPADLRDSVKKDPVSKSRYD